MGLKVADIDLNISNVEDMRKCLQISKCKAIFFDPVTETQDNLLLLRKSIPELYECTNFIILLLLKLFIFIYYSYFR